MTGYDRRQLARAERLLEQALRQVRRARARLDGEAMELRAGCYAASVNAWEADLILENAAKRIGRRMTRRRGVS